MTLDELKTIWSENMHSPHSEPMLIIHNNMKTVKFWPLSFEETPDAYKLHGWWFGIQINDLLEQETISIKKEDLQHWSISNGNA